MCLPGLGVTLDGLAPFANIQPRITTQLWKVRRGKINSDLVSCGTNYFSQDYDYRREVFDYPVEHRVEMIRPRSGAYTTSKMSRSGCLTTRQLWKALSGQSLCTPRTVSWLLAQLSWLSRRSLTGALCNVTWCAVRHIGQSKTNSSSFCSADTRSRYSTNVATSER